MEPVLLVLAASTGAALAAALGILPLLHREEPPLRWLGWSNALAAGLMLACAFALLEPRFHSAAIPIFLGATLGIGFTYATRVFSQTGDLALNKLDEEEPQYGYEVLLVTSIHSAAEGVAVGAAMASNRMFGLIVAAALALHNIPEGTLLAAVFRGRGVRAGRAASLAVVSNLGLVLMAVTTFALIQAVPDMLPWALSFAAGALIYLSMEDLLAESYKEAGSTSIALAVILALWVFGMIHAALLPEIQLPGAPPL